MKDVRSELFEASLHLGDQLLMIIAVDQLDASLSLGSLQVPIIND